MEYADFEKLKNDFISSDLENKIDLYVGTEGLSQAQYKELLRHFPLEELPRLEAALA